MKKKEFINKLSEYSKNFIPVLFIIDYKLKNFHLIEAEKAFKNKIFFKVDRLTNFKKPKKNFNVCSIEKYPIPYSEYKRSFDEVSRNIRSGNTYLLNLTFPTEIKSNLTLEEIFYFSKAKYKLFFKNEFICFSPECFVKIVNGKILSFPMKGTIDASIPEAKKIILKDKKETAEHYTIVDLIRNDLSMVAKNVKVEKFRFIQKIKTNQKTLLQVSSRISGDLPNDYNENIGEILLKLLPAGSISGAPKKKTLEIIDDVEKSKRGYYTGIFGYYDGKNLDSAVMIRFIENTKNGLVYKSGGGITSFSDPRKEYQELIDKVYVPII